MSRKIIVNRLFTRAGSFRVCMTPLLPRRVVGDRLVRLSFSRSNLRQVGQIYSSSGDAPRKEEALKICSAMTACIYTRIELPAHSMTLPLVLFDVRGAGQSCLEGGFLLLFFGLYTRADRAKSRG